MDRLAAVARVVVESARARERVRPTPVFLFRVQVRRRGASPRRRRALQRRCLNPAVSVVSAVPEPLFSSSATPRVSPSFLSDLPCARACLRASPLPRSRPGAPANASAAGGRFLTENERAPSLFSNARAPPQLRPALPVGDRKGPVSVTRARSAPRGTGTQPSAKRVPVRAVYQIPDPSPAPTVPHVSERGR